MNEYCTHTLMTYMCIVGRECKYTTNGFLHSISNFASLFLSFHFHILILVFFFVFVLNVLICNNSAIEWFWIIIFYICAGEWNWGQTNHHKTRFIISECPLISDWQVGRTREYTFVVCFVIQCLDWHHFNSLDEIADPRFVEINSQISQRSYFSAQTRT